MLRIGGFALRNNLLALHSLYLMLLYIEFPWLPNRSHQVRKTSSLTVLVGLESNTAPRLIAIHVGIVVGFAHMKGPVGDDEAGSASRGGG